MKISTTIVLILFGICCAQLVSAAQEDATNTRANHHFLKIPGLDISYKSDVSNHSPDRLQHQLLLQIRKCMHDSLHFSDLIGSVTAFKQSSGRSLKLHAEIEHSQMLLSPIALDEFAIDLGDLRVLPIQ